MQPPRFLGQLTLLAWLVVLSMGSLEAAPIPYRAGDVVTTNFGMQNRLLWTNDNSQVFTPSNTTIHLQDFSGKIVFFMFFDVW